MNTRHYFPLFILSCLLAFPMKAQLFVDNSYTIEEMVTDFFSNSCVTPSNISTTGVAESVAFFDAGAAGLGVPAGILISTGNVAYAVGPNSGNASHNVGIDGDADLDNLLGATTYDAVTIEMDIVSTEALLEFSYVFASEEYPEYVGSSFNDVFAFFISGPGIDGTQNIALIPGTTQPVAINNVNANTNSNFYVDNANGQAVEFDGFTTEMTAQAQVTPNETYHVKIVIADAMDSILDSGIFLGIESLCGESSLPLTNDETVTVNGNAVTFENNTRYASSHFWDFGDGTTSTEKTPAPHTYAADGVYEISLTTSNFCCSDITTTEVQIGAVNSLVDLEQRPYSISPNPIKEFGHINMENGGEFKIRVFNPRGELLFSKRGQGSTRLEFTDLPPGLYFMELRIDGEVYIEKIIKD